MFCVWIMWETEGMREKKKSGGERRNWYRVCLDWTYFCWNWKHCSEIIFKCVNSVVGPIFNKKVIESVICRTREQCMYALFTVDKVNYCGLNKKKENKREKRRGETQTPVSLPSKRAHNSSWYNFLSRKIDLALLQCSLD